jgi:hypothetical protein
MRTLMALLIAITPAWAHSWYPPECCSDSDCYPLPEGSVTKVEGGYALDTGEFIPESKAKEGKDGRYHICRYPFPAVICFFKPFNGV